MSFGFLFRAFPEVAGFSKPNGRWYPDFYRVRQIIRRFYLRFECPSSEMLSGSVEYYPGMKREIASLKRRCLQILLFGPILVDGMT